MPAVRASFNQPTESSQDVKERFYRHFQEEVTGKSITARLIELKILTS